VLGGGGTQTATIELEEPVWRFALTTCWPPNKYDTLRFAETTLLMELLALRMERFSVTMEKPPRRDGYTNGASQV
jgi:hypothetical protein